MNTSQCARVLEVLQDGQPHPVPEIHDRAGTMRLNSRVAELRKQGHNIVCSRVPGRSGAAGYAYQLVGSVKDAAPGVLRVPENEPQGASGGASGEGNEPGTGAAQTSGQRVTARGGVEQAPLRRQPAHAQLELDGLYAERARLIDAADRNPHLDHWKLPGQVAALDRGIGRLQGVLGGAGQARQDGKSDGLGKQPGTVGKSAGVSRPAEHTQEAA